MAIRICLIGLFWPSAPRQSAVEGRARKDEAARVAHQTSEFYWQAMQNALEQYKNIVTVAIGKTRGQCGSSPSWRQCAGVAGDAHVAVG